MFKKSESWFHVKSNINLNLTDQKFISICLALSGKHLNKNSLVFNSYFDHRYLKNNTKQICNNQ